MSRWQLAGILFILAAVHLYLATTIAPHDDELYYWCWSQDLQASYFDHPPLTAILIRLSTTLFGNSHLGIRFFACLSTIGILLFIAEMTDRRGICWLFLTPILSIGCILMTPDSALLFFWSAYAVWLIRMQDRSGGLRDHFAAWTLGGLLLGLGGLSKYTMALAAPGAALALWLAGNRTSLRWGWGFLYHLAIAVVLVSPVLLFNGLHDFEPLRYQFAHASRTGRQVLNLDTLGDFIGAQFILIGALPFVIAPWCYWRRRELMENSRLRTCACLFLIPWCFFLVKSVRGRVEGNWPLIAYMTLLPLALCWVDTLKSPLWKRWSFPLSFALPSVLTVVLLVHSLFRLPLPASVDRLSKSEARFEMVQHIAAWAKEEQIGKIYCVNYQLTSQLRFNAVPSNQLPGLCRPSNFTLMPDDWRDQGGLFVLWYMKKDGKAPPLPYEGYALPQIVRTFPETINGEPGGDYLLVRYDRFPAPEARLTFSSRQGAAAPLR